MKKLMLFILLISANARAFSIDGDKNREKLFRSECTFGTMAEARFLHNRAMVDPMRGEYQLGRVHLKLNFYDSFKCTGEANVEISNWYVFRKYSRDQLGRQTQYEFEFEMGQGRDVLISKKGNSAQLEILSYFVNDCFEKAISQVNSGERKVVSIKTCPLGKLTQKHQCDNWNRPRCPAGQDYILQDTYVAKEYRFKRISDTEFSFRLDKYIPDINFQEVKL